MVDIDRRTVIQILGSLMNNPSLLNNTDEYQFEPNDFPQQLDKYIFSAIYNLYAGGAESIHTIDVDTYLQHNELAKKVMEESNGIAFLQDCESYCEPSNFNYYYNRFKKLALLRELQRSGKDVSKFYCDDPLNPNSDEINQKFEQLSTSDIINNLRGELSILENKYATNTTIERGCAYDGIEDLIKELQVKPEIGIPLQGDIFNTITRGGRKGKLYLRSAGSGVGKALPNYTKVPTPNGWSIVADIKVGDYLFDKNGKPTQVLAVYPQEEKKRVFKVYFKSGRIAECCDEHLWSYYKDNKSNKIFTSTLREIIDNKNGLINDDGSYNYFIPVCKPIEYKKRTFAIDPYIIGMSLANGTSLFSRYMFGSIEQRFDLLAGLLDAKGKIFPNGLIYFSTENELLKNNIIELCESLGMICNCSSKSKDCKRTYDINIKARLQDRARMFKIPSNINKVTNSIDDFEDRDAIIKIESTDIYEEMTCFYVDNDEHLFLMNDFIVTHNTRSMIGDACNIAYPIRYEPKYGKWISTGTAEPVLYVMTEQDTAEIQTMILAYLTGINEEVFLYGLFKEEHMDRIHKALDIMKKYKDNMLYARIPDPCASVIKNLFREYSLQKNVENFFYDYIFSSPAMLNEYRDLKLREDVALRLFTTTLKNLAIELNAFILTSTQISNDDDKSGGFKDFRNIQGSKSIANLTDFACIMSRPSQEELKLVEGFQSRYKFTPNVITDVFKNRRGRWTQVRIWSTNDLGTLRKYDLFVTTPNNKPIEDFQIVNFNITKKKEYRELEDLYNDGVVTDKMIEELLSNLEEKSQNSSFVKNIEEAFGNMEEQKNRFQNMNFEDLL